MSDNQLNIKSSTIEKALNLAKEFLGKLISPTVVENPTQIQLAYKCDIEYSNFDRIEAGNTN